MEKSNDAFIKLVYGAPLGEGERKIRNINVKLELRLCIKICNLPNIQQNIIPIKYR